MSISIKLKKLFEKKYIDFIFFAFIIICWLPTIIAFFPGISNYDGSFQIRTYFSNTITSHHPIIHTLLLSSLYEFGSIIFKSYSLGFFMNSLFQIIVMAAIYSYTTKIIFNKTNNLLFTIITLLFFSIFPINAIFPLMTTKDVLFSGLVLLYIALFFKLVDQSTYSNLDFIKLVIVAALMLLFRNNAIYAFIPAVLFYFFTRKTEFKKKFIISSVIAIILYFVFSLVLMSTTHAGKGSNREKLSVITQSIARISKYHSNILTADEKQKIEYYFGDFNMFVKMYMPSLSDNSKGLLLDDRLESNKKEFYNLFLTLACKYPRTCIESFLATTKGYWDIFDTTFCKIRNKEFPRAKGYLEITFQGVTGDTYTIPDYLPSVREFYIKLFCENNYLYVPVLNVLSQPATYFYFLIIFLIYVLCQRDTKSLFPTIFLLLYFLSCFLGPNAIVRYIYCVIICTPILISRLASNKN